MSTIQMHVFLLRRTILLISETNGGIKNEKFSVINLYIFCG